MPTRRQREEAERAEYLRLRSKYGKRRRQATPAPEEGEEDDGAVTVFSGKAGSAFLDRFFGPGTPPAPAAGSPDEDEDDDDLDEDEDEDDEPEADPPSAARGPRFFR